ncbi:MAG: FAD-dependent oxidoreductase, partial [Acidobacteria bacterium]|nr:FAD-dependent oxidoreductase [Acidobacteriota bacterium]
MSALLDGVFDADVVVVGGGIAGLATALACGDRRVAVLSKVPVSGHGAGGSSVWAQGGIAAAMGADDTPELHAADTIAAGAGLVHDEAVTVLTREGPARLAELLELGARFDRDGEGRLLLGREAAHGRRRILHANGDATGAEVVRAMLAAVGEHERVRFHG